MEDAYAGPARLAGGIRHRGPLVCQTTAACAQVPQGEADGERARPSAQPLALSRTEVVRLLDVWAEDPRPVAIRNTALLRLMI